MRLSVRPLALAALAALALSGCHSNGSTPNAPFSRATTVAELNASGQSLSTYPATSTGTVTPTTYLVGAATTISSNSLGLSYDHSGNLWVANFAIPDVLEFSGSATGNTAPTNTLSGANTTFVEPSAVCVTSSGTIYVADYSADAIDIFSAGATGNVAPATRIVGAATGLNGPGGISVDSNGNIWVANYTGDSIEEFSSSATGNASPTVTISGGATTLSEPWELARDRSGNIWVANHLAGTIDEFASSATGNVAPMNSITLAGATGVALDARGYIYTVNASTAIYVYAPGATGAATPAQTITSADISNPWSVAAH